MPTDPGTPVAAAEDPAGGLARVQDELAGLAERPLSQHPDVFARVQAELHGVLASLDRL